MGVSADYIDENYPRESLIFSNDCLVNSVDLELREFLRAVSSIKSISLQSNQEVYYEPFRTHGKVFEDKVYLIRRTSFYICPLNFEYEDDGVSYDFSCDVYRFCE